MSIPTSRFVGANGRGATSQPMVANQWRAVFVTRRVFGVPSRARWNLTATRPTPETRTRFFCSFHPLFACLNPNDLTCPGFLGRGPRCPLAPRRSHAFQAAFRSPATWARQWVWTSAAARSLSRKTLTSRIAP